MVRKAIELLKLRAESAFDIVHMEEPYELFNRFGNLKPLELCAENIKENAAACQWHITKCMNREMRRSVKSLRAERETTRPIVLLCDRSLRSPDIFIRALEKMEIISPFTGQVLAVDAAEQELDTCIECNIRFIGMAYLHTPLVECLSRIKKRARNFEVNISAEYLAALEESHEVHLDSCVENYGGEIVFRFTDNNAADLIEAIESTLALALKAEKHIR